MTSCFCKLFICLLEIMLLSLIFIQVYSLRAFILKICEKNLSKKNKCIVIGGGIGFIPTLVYHKTKNDILAFEINKKIIKNLNQNLLLNHCKFKLYNNNLVFDNKNSSTFYHTVNFLETSGYFKTKDKYC